MEEFAKSLMKINNALHAHLPKQKRDFLVPLDHSINLFRKGKGPQSVTLLGFRGVGKTTAMLQIQPRDGIYFSADNIGFKEHTLYETVEFFRENMEKRIFFIDEVHLYPHWSREIKNILDSIPDVFLVMSGSAAIKIRKMAYDLSRRSYLINAEPMKLHEFLRLKTGKTPTLFSLNSILSGPIDAALKTGQQFPKLQSLYNEYIHYGGLPTYFRGDMPSQLVLNSIKRSIYFDIPSVSKVSLPVLKKTEKLLLYIAKSDTGEFTYETASKILGISKGSVYELIDALVDSHIIRLLHPFTGQAQTLVRKKPKIYFSHPSLRHAILENAGEPEAKGAYREEFFYAHLKDIVPRIGFIPGFRGPDFKLNYRKKNYIFEVGKHKQPKYSEEVFNVEDRKDAKYPLSLFGFLKKDKV